MTSNVTPLNVPYRTLLDLSEKGAVAVLKKTGDQFQGQVQVADVVGDAIILRYEDGSAVTLAHLG